MRRVHCENKFIKSYKYKHKRFATARRWWQKEKRRKPIIGRDLLSPQTISSKVIKARLKTRALPAKSLLIYLFVALAALHQVPSRLAFCPSKCICNDQLLSANCTQVPSLSIVPITLNPLLKQLTLNQLPIVELANGLSVYRQLEYLNLASNQVRQISYENFNFKPAPHSVNLFATQIQNNNEHIAPIADRNQQHEWNAKQESMARYLRLSIDKSVSGSSFGNQEDEIGFHLRELDLQDNKIDQLGSFVESDPDLDFDFSETDQPNEADKRRHHLRAPDLERRAPFLMLTKLESLNLSRNKLVTLNQHVFLGLLHLKQLDLSRNQLEYINQHSLIGLIELQVLKLSHNKLATHLNKLKVAFCGGPMTEMRHLDLSDNDKAPPMMGDQPSQQPLASTIDVLLPNQMFICAPKLVSLRLDGLPLRHIQVSAFDNVQQLETLNLSRNFLEHVPNEPLSNPRSNLTLSLRQLDLSDTLIEFVNSRSFETLKNLQRLSMNSMRHLVSFDLAALSFSPEQEVPLLDNYPEKLTNAKAIYDDKKGSENIEQLIRRDGDFREAIKTLLPDHLFQRTISNGGTAGDVALIEQPNLDAPRNLQRLWQQQQQQQQQLINDQLIELQLRNCRRLQSMHSSLASRVRFTKLRLIDLNGANELRELPLDKMINLSQSASASSKLNVDLSFAGQLNCSSCQMSWLVEVAKWEQRGHASRLEDNRHLLGVPSGWFHVDQKSELPSDSDYERVTLIGSDLVGCSWPIAMPLAHLAASLLADNNRQLASRLCGHQPEAAPPSISALDELSQQIQAGGFGSQLGGGGGGDTSPSGSQTRAEEEKSPAKQEKQPSTDFGSLLVALVAAIILAGLIGRLLVTVISSHTSCREGRQQFKWSRSASVSLAASSQLNSPATSSSGGQNNAAAATNNNNNDCSSSSIMSSLAANGPMSARQCHWTLNGLKVVSQKQPQADESSYYQSVQFAATSGPSDRRPPLLYGGLIGVDELIFSGLADGQIERRSNNLERVEQRLGGNLFSRIKAQCSGSKASRLVNPAHCHRGGRSGGGGGGYPATSSLKAWLANLRGGSRQLARLSSTSTTGCSSHPAASSYPPTTSAVAQWLPVRQQQQQLPMLPVDDGRELLEQGRLSDATFMSMGEPKPASSAGGRRPPVNHSPSSQLMKPAQNFGSVYENSGQHLYHVVVEQQEAAMDQHPAGGRKELQAQQQHQQLITGPSSKLLAAGDCLRQQPTVKQLRARQTDGSGSSEACPQDSPRSAGRQVNSGLGQQRYQALAHYNNGSSTAAEKHDRAGGAQVYLSEQRKPQYNEPGHLKPDGEGRLQLASAVGCPGGAGGGFTAALAADRHIYVTLDRPIKQQNVVSGHYERNATSVQPRGTAEKQQLQLERTEQWAGTKGGFSDNLGHSILPDDYKSFEWSNSGERQQQQADLDGALETVGKFKAPLEEQQQQTRSTKTKTSLSNSRVCNHEEPQFESQSVKLSLFSPLECQPSANSPVDRKTLENNRLLQNGLHQGSNHLAEAEQHYAIYDNSSDFAVKKRKSHSGDGSHKGNVTGHSDYDDGRLKARLRAAPTHNRQQLLFASELNGNPVPERLDEPSRINENPPTTDVRLTGLLNSPSFERAFARPSLTDNDCSVAQRFNSSESSVANGKYDANHDVVVVANRRNLCASAVVGENVVSTTNSNGITQTATTTTGASRQLNAVIAPTANNAHQTSPNDDDAGHNNNVQHYDDYVINGSAGRPDKANLGRAQLNHGHPFPVALGDKAAELAGLGVPASPSCNGIDESRRHRFRHGDRLSEPAQNQSALSISIGQQQPNDETNNRKLSNEEFMRLRSKLPHAQTEQVDDDHHHECHEEEEFERLHSANNHHQGVSNAISGRQTSGGATWRRSTKLSAANEIYSNQFYYCKPSMDNISRADDHSS